MIIKTNKDNHQVNPQEKNETLNNNHQVNPPATLKHHRNLGKKNEFESMIYIFLVKLLDIFLHDAHNIIILHN